jgi:uncharacterized peroxidase-related enzyme
MTRVRPFNIDELPARQQQAVQRAEELMGFVSNDTMTMARKPALMNAFASLVGAVYAPGAISSGMKRLLGLMTSSAAGCTYCVGHTAFASERQGIETDKLQAIWEFETSDQFDAAERAALRVALHAGQSPNGVTDEMFAQLADFYDEDAQLEIVSVIALFGFLNRWNSTLATDLESLPAATLQTFGLGTASG